MGENNILPLNSDFIILVVTQRKREAREKREETAQKSEPKRGREEAAS